MLTDEWHEYIDLKYHNFPIYPSHLHPNKWRFPICDNFPTQSASQLKFSHATKTSKMVQKMVDECVAHSHWLSNEIKMLTHNFPCAHFPHNIPKFWLLFIMRKICIHITRDYMQTLNSGVRAETFFLFFFLLFVRRVAHKFPSTSSCSSSSSSSSSSSLSSPSSHHHHNHNHNQDHEYRSSTLLHSHVEYGTNKVKKKMNNKKQSEKIIINKIELHRRNAYKLRISLLRSLTCSLARTLFGVFVLDIRLLFNIV